MTASDDSVYELQVRKIDEELLRLTTMLQHGRRRRSNPIWVLIIPSVLLSVTVLATGGCSMLPVAALLATPAGLVTTWLIAGSPRKTTPLQARIRWLHAEREELLSRMRKFNAMQ